MHRQRLALAVILTLLLAQIGAAAACACPPIRKACNCGKAGNCCKMPKECSRASTAIADVDYAQFLFSAPAAVILATPTPVASEQLHETPPRRPDKAPPRIRTPDLGCHTLRAPPSLA
ncbi:MAG TPA: hypothetical protein VFG65_06055 [Fimbriimonadales bacterium]|nr:hypothetical protein [Fimbriimonadales bacterium]